MRVREDSRDMQAMERRRDSGVRIAGCRVLGE
jgi:hypothetical protein